MKGKIVILGAGESGVGAALLAQKEGYAVFVSDYGTISEENKTTLSDAAIDFEEGKHTDSKILDATEIIKSPGIPGNTPLLLQAKKAHIPVISEIEFAARYSNGKFVAITGSNGKTTTTLLTYHLIKNSGANVGLAGNIGQSLARQLCDGDKDIWVLELSSFQLDDMYAFKADIAVLLNITPDHLDRYEYNFEKYTDSKFRITQNQTKDDYFIHVCDDPTLRQEVPTRDIEAFKLCVSLEDRVLNGAYLSKNRLMINVFNHITRVFNIKLEDLPLSGKHNIMNIGVAILAASAAGVNQSVITNSLPTFQNAAHRLEPVAMINHVRYINDSKATNVEAVKFALEAFPKPIIWIAGGVDKGNDYSQLDEVVFERVKTLICLGKDNKKLTQYFGNKIDSVISTDSMSKAVAIASEISTAGDTVMLSPACASFDLFKNYEHRGDCFKHEVKILEDKQQKLNLSMF